MREPRTAARIASAISFRVAHCADPSIANLRQVRRQISLELRREAPDVIVRVAQQFVRDGAIPRWLAYELLNHDVRAMARLKPKDVENLAKGMSTWGDVDAFACYVAGPAWREGRLETEDIVGWTASANRWWRRAALVSTVPLNNTARGGRGDATRTTLICDLLRHDRDDMVIKALSWALRELAKKEPGVVEAYVSKREAELPPRVVREVRNKLLTGLKNPKSRRTGA